MATVSYIVRNLGLATGVVALAAACTTVTDAGAEVGTTRSALIEAAEELKGTNNGDKSIILTFDDGPGPMDVTGELSGWLRDRGIKATFFVNGACVKSTRLSNNSACDYPIEDADEVLRKITADGHLVANHTTTHRSLTGASDGYNVIPEREWVKDITETDDAIKEYVPTNRFFFRPPYGDWSSNAHDVLQDSPMKKYIGPVYWNVGGGPTDGSRAADWECWDPYAGKSYTSKRCGDLYLKEIRNMGGGIVLMHEAKGNTGNHAVSHGVGNTVDMVKYIVPILENEGWTFKPLWEDADIVDLLPKCAAGTFDSGGTCKTCSTCRSGTSQACTATSDAVCIGGATNNESLAGTGTASTSTGNTAKDGEAAKTDAGCNAGGAGAGSWGLALAALALIRRRRQG